MCLCLLCLLPVAPVCLLRLPWLLSSTLRHALHAAVDGVRDIAVIFRGTITGGEWKTNFLGDKCVV